jgi:hypothetical protein
MNKCIERDIQEMLPDLLHGTLAGDARARAEAHLAGCAECSEDLEVLRTVKTAAVFAPSIDIDRVVRQIPPYTPLVTVPGRPARTRVVSWLVAASLALVVASGGSLLLQQRVNPPRSIPRGVGASRVALGGGKATSKSTDRVTPSTPGPAVAARPHALALANDVEGLSDGDLRQLMSDMGRFDALPAPEPEPVISVDTGDGLGQDTR